MASIGFLGLGKMGSPMMLNLLKAGHRIKAFDVVPSAMTAAGAAGAQLATDAADAARGVEVVVSMLPAGQHVRTAYLDDGGILSAATPATLLIECSTIDVDTARAVNRAAAARGVDMVDAPVSGGVGGAAAATLTFMVGGTESAFQRAEPILQAMGKAVIHTGDAGTGQAAKICNNMLLGISMIGVCEAFTLASRLGLDAQKLFDVSSKASGQCWSLTSYCPVPGPVPTSPANRDYKAGFTAAMMLKDLRLAQQAAQSSGAATPLGALAESLYALFCGAGSGDTDFSGIIRMLEGRGQG